MKPRVFISRQIQQVGIDRAREVCDVDVWEDARPPSRDALIERVRGVDGVLCTLTEPIDAGVMDAAGVQLAVISTMAVGYDNIDVQAAAARRVAVGHTPGVLTDATADLTMALLLAAARRIPEGMAYIRAGQWKTWMPRDLLGRELSGATLGIIGYGRIGQAVARRAQAFDMRVIVHSRSGRGDRVLVDRETLLRESDFVSLHVPLTPETRGLIDHRALIHMKPSAIVINTARGPVVDQAALTWALREGVIAGAALDVTDPEPIALDDPLLSMPNVIVIPHMGSATTETRDRMALMAAENLIAGVVGMPLPHPVPV